jgi:hypothetical protein
MESVSSSSGIAADILDEIGIVGYMDYGERRYSTLAGRGLKAVEGKGF